MATVATKLKALEVVVEILFEDDLISRILTKLRTYHRWGFEQVYLVDPPNRVLFRWHEHRLEEVSELAGIPADRIWSRLDLALQ